jgi:hypothetical protein
MRPGAATTNAMNIAFVMWELNAFISAAAANHLFAQW